jgi:hypothetical protein
MTLVDRVKNIIVSPKTEWPRIAEESTTVSGLYTGYIMILAAIGPIAMAIAMPLVGAGAAIVAYLIGLLVTYLLALIVDALAPSFGGEKGFVQSLKLVAYSYTAAWVAGIFNLLPGIGRAIALIAAIYAFYTFFLGAPVLRKSSADKAAIFTVIVVICGLLLGFLLSAVLMTTLFGSAMVGSMMR